MTYSGVTTYQKKFGKQSKSGNAIGFRTLLDDSKTIVLKWRRVQKMWIGLLKRTTVLAQRSVRLILRDRTACLQRVSIAWTKHCWAWLVLTAVTSRRIAETLWFLIRIVLWLLRLLTAPPQQIGPVSAYRKRNTGMAISPLEMSLVVFAVLMIAGTLL